MEEHTNQAFHRFKKLWELKVLVKSLKELVMRVSMVILYYPGLCEYKENQKRRAREIQNSNGSYNKLILKLSPYFYSKIKKMYGCYIVTTSSLLVKT